jgi:hypothetical protein
MTINRCICFCGQRQHQANTVSAVAIRHLSVPVLAPSTSDTANVPLQSVRCAQTHCSGYLSDAARVVKSQGVAVFHTRRRA